MKPMNWDESTGHHQVTHAAPRKRSRGNLHTAVDPEEADHPAMASSGSALSGWRRGGVLAPGAEYLLSWAALVASAVVLAATEKVQPREHYVLKVALPYSAYPVRPNTVPPWAMPLICIAVPSALFAAWVKAQRRRPMEAHSLVVGLLAAVLFTGALVNVVKVTIGRLRPDFNDRCWPDGKVVWKEEGAMGGVPNCTGNAGDVAEGRKSFPSGHSAWAAAGLGYLSLFAADRLRPGSGQPWRLLAAALPWLCAVFIGLSRYVDYMHHWTDIATGLALGGVVAWAAFQQQAQRLAEGDALLPQGARHSEPEAQSLTSMPL